MPHDALTFDAPENAAAPEQEISGDAAAPVPEGSENTAGAAPGTFGAYGTTAGTAILIGAGAYTFVRTNEEREKAGAGIRIF